MQRRKSHESHPLMVANTVPPPPPPPGRPDAGEDEARTLAYLGTGVVGPGAVRTLLRAKPEPRPVRTVKDGEIRTARILDDLGAPPEPAYTTEGALAVCERCGATTGCERSLYGLAHAETDHALTGCNGRMYLASYAGERVGFAPAPPPLPPPDLNLFERIKK